MDLKNKRIIISKINQLGDVMCALPLASAIKKVEPTAHIIFMSRQYAKSLIEHYADVDEFADVEAITADGEEQAVKRLAALKADIILQIMDNKPIHPLFALAKKAKIPVRIGNIRRSYTWRYCNRFVWIQRNKSGLHEAQLDMKFLRPLLGGKKYSRADIIALQRFKPFSGTADCIKLLDKNKFNLILHPKTRGQHIEWSPENFSKLINLLPPEKFNIFVTGSAAEGAEVQAAMMDPHPHVINLCGKTTLPDLLDLIYHADGLICASTGPVHLAAAFGIYTLGLYAPIKPCDAGRWGPLGKKAEVLAINKDCNACAPQKGQPVPKCACINDIKAQQVAAVMNKWHQEKFLLKTSVTETHEPLQLKSQLSADQHREIYHVPD